MKVKNQKGFTIIEVVLFLALTGLVIGIAFMGLRGRTDNIRYTDSMRSLENFIQDQLNKVRSGALPEIGKKCRVTGGNVIVSDSGVNDGNCIVLGRIMEFQAADNSEIIKVHQVVGKRDTDSYICNPPEPCQSIEKAEPAYFGKVEEFTIPWQSSFTRGALWGIHGFYDEDDPEDVSQRRYRDSGSYPRTLLLGFFRHPDSTYVVPLGYNLPDSASLDESEIIDVINNQQAYTEDPDDAGDYESTLYYPDPSAKICFITPNDRLALINFAVYDKQEAISLDFLDGTGSKNCKI